MRPGSFDAYGALGRLGDRGVSLGSERGEGRVEVGKTLRRGW